MGDNRGLISLDQKSLSYKTYYAFNTILLQYSVAYWLKSTEKEVSFRGRTGSLSLLEWDNQNLLSALGSGYKLYAYL